MIDRAFKVVVIIWLACLTAFIVGESVNDRKHLLELSTSLTKLSETTKQFADEAIKTQHLVLILAQRQRG